MNATNIKATEMKAEPAVKARFFLMNPRAEEISLAGSFNNWNPAATPLVHEGRGRWAIEVPLPPGRYEYQFVVDGHWQLDPSAKESVFNPLGGLNSVLVVTAPADRRADAFPAGSCAVPQEIGEAI
jgi:1,4-alpha-glucan branching enzyme